MTSSSNDTDRRALAKVISAAVGGWNAETRAITNVADAILTEFLPGHDERVKAEAFLEGAEAFAWAQSNGDDPAHYVVENNPYERRES